MDKKYKYILFDVSGVLAGYLQQNEENVLKNFGVPFTKFAKNWFDSKAVIGYESGDLTTKEFAIDRAKELDFKITPQNIIKILESIKNVVFEGVEELLYNLAANNYQLAVLSNTNEIHWNSIQNRYIIDRYIKKQFLSHQIGYVKPDEKSYKFVINSLSCKPEEILFFDDMQKNVNVAKTVGLSAHKVLGIDELKLKISEILNL